MCCESIAKLGCCCKSTFCTLIAVSAVTALVVGILGIQGTISLPPQTTYGLAIGGSFVLLLVGISLGCKMICPCA